MDVHCPVGIRNLGPPGSGVVGSQGSISRQTTSQAIPPGKLGPIVPGQDLDFDQPHP